MTSLKKGDPKFVYKPPPPPATDTTTDADDDIESTFPPLDAMDLGTYTRADKVSNLTRTARPYFDLGLREMLCYQHEAATHAFLACLYYAPDCALAHGLLALCHAPNYNFKGEAYYGSTHGADPETRNAFPSQQLADRHSQAAMAKVEELRKRHKPQPKRNKGKKKRNKTKQQAPVTATTTTTTTGDSSTVIHDLESQWLSAIRILTSCPGIDASLSDETVGRPYANAMQKLYARYGEDDPDVAYLYAESIMVLHAWKLYEYPTGKPLSPEVEVVASVLETSLQRHPNHAGLCHMYVHLVEMSSRPRKALAVACPPLRTSFPHAGHLIHMSTHIDVLVGDYDGCVQYNKAAIRADKVIRKIFPSTAGFTSFYFGYMVHNYHMLAYGAILGGFERVGTEAALELNGILTQDAFSEYPDLVSYLESYSALDLHVLVRFGRWNEILKLPPPRDERLMLFRAATLAYARGLAFAQLDELDEAKREADRLDAFRKLPEAEERILHNNPVSDLLAVDAPMLRGEIAYQQQQYEEAFALLRNAVELQDSLRFDEPWGVMQPVRHALGGLLLEQGRVREAQEVLQVDLKLHPNNPWALTGLIACLKKKKKSCCTRTSNNNDDGGSEEIAKLQEALDKQRQSEWADYNISVACACCQTETPSGNSK